MSYLSLYRKYRPKSFANVVGQEYIVKILKNSIKNNQIANAYVFAGTKGTGKTSIAKIFANAMNCLQNHEGDVCGQCEICQDFASGKVVDVIELDGASNNGVDEVRQINDAAVFLPAKLNKKVYIIDEAHMLTTQAWNALLKLVEEPPKHVVFIFATTEMHKIPATILSRCQCFRFNKITHNDMIKMLMNVCKSENIQFENEALDLIANIADGSARDALSILEQAATYSDNNIKTNDIYKIYGLLSPNEVIDFINLFSSKDSKPIFVKANEYLQSGVNFVNFVNLIVSILTDKLIYIKTNNASLLSKINQSQVSSININDETSLMELLDIWQDTYFKISTPTDVHVVIDHAIIKSLALFDNNVVKQTTPIKLKQKENTQLEIKKETKVETKQPLFNLYDVDVPSKKQEEMKEIRTETSKKENKKILMPNEVEILISVFANRNAECEKQAVAVLNDVKSGKIDDKTFTHAQRASKVICASKNGVILLFDDEMDAKLFNNVVKKPEFILSCCKIFRDPKYVVGFTKQQLNSHKEEMLSAKKNRKDFLDLSPLREVLDKNNSIEQIAYDTIYKFIDEKDRK